MYQIVAIDGRAKSAHMETVHGTIETPVFMKVNRSNSSSAFYMLPHIPRERMRENSRENVHRNPALWYCA